MRLIDSDKLVARIENAWDWQTLGPTMTSLLKATINDIKISQEIKAIPIDWLQKTLIDLMYDGVCKEDVLHVFYKAIAKWEKENDRQADD